MAFTNDHLMQVAPMRLRERNLFMSAPDDHPIRIVANPKRLRASLNGRVVADTMRALTLFEASYPGVRYVPLADVDMTVLRRSTHKTRCPFKGEASYYSIVTANGRRGERDLDLREPVSRSRQDRGLPRVRYDPGGSIRRRQSLDPRLIGRKRQ
jgi:uncharacterized protein (DUF427 family)